MELSIDVQGMESLAENLQATIVQVRAGTAAGVAKVAEAVRDAAQENVLSMGAVDTGELLDKIQTTPVEVSDDAIEARVESGAKHSIYVEMGTGPVGAASHDGINPEANPVYTDHGWTFPLPDGSGFRYTEGMPARPFMYPAKKLVEDQAKGIIAEEVRKAVQNGE